MALLFAALPPAAPAQDATGEAGRAAAAAGPPVVTAVRADAPVVMDGRMDEEAWKHAPAAGGFTQREPRPGAPATEATEFRVLYDDRGLYFGIRAHDREPRRLVRDLHGRDVAVLTGRYDYWGQDDAVSILLDTFHDGRNAYYFSVNPNGARTDGLITNEGQVRNFDWQGVWEAAAQVDDAGWTVEIFIPWTTLRFPSASARRVGLNVQRVIRRRTEETFWAPLGLSETIWWVSRAGVLEGLELPAAAWPLEVKPFVVGSRSRGPSFGGRATELEPGFDMKVGLRDALTLDLTYNTDFAQVEVDEQQINLTRFPLFFPEKREFFLENAGLFEVGVERFVQLFFSRRVGMDVDGRPVPIMYGSRLTGRAAGFELGGLAIRTDETTATPGAVHSVFRARRNILARSTVGMIVTDLRQGGGGPDNQVLAVDVDLNPWRYLGFEAYAARSTTSGIGAGWSAGGILHWNTDELGIRFVFNEHQSAFVPGMGFLPRPAVRHYQPGGRAGIRPGRGPVRRIVVRSISDFIHDRDWEQLTRSSWIQTIWTLESADEAQVQVTNRFERLDAPFRIHPEVTIPEGEYVFTRGLVRLTASERRRVSGSLRYEWGEFFSGSRATYEARAHLRAGSHLAFTPRYEHNRVRLAEGDFTTNLAGVRVNVAPSNRVSFNAFVQYNDAIDRFSTNLRFRFIHSPGSDLYLVYNDSRDLLENGWPVEDRQHIIKLTYLWRFR